MSALIIAKNLTLGYKNEIIIKNANFAVNQYDFIFISGKSGSGKSTLLRALYGDLAPKSGDLSVLGLDLSYAKAAQIAALRRAMGVIFQDYKLINSWNVEKNVMLPMMIAGFGRDVWKNRIENLLKHVNLSHKASKMPLELSGGEQQRVAMARALSHNPHLILADEPTGNLDDYSSDVIWRLLREVNQQLKITVLVVTHRIPEMFGINYRHLRIEEGEIYEVS